MNTDIQIVFLDGTREIIPKIKEWTLIDGVLTLFNSHKEIVIQYNIRALRSWRATDV